MRICFIMDPLAGVLIDKDTTFALMLEAQRRGHEVFWAGILDLFAQGGEAMVTLRGATVARKEGDHHRLGDPQDVRLADLDCVFIRKDPPFDATYLYATHLCELARGKTLLVNDPRGLRDANEKLYALHFPDLIPRTIVTRDMARARAFVAANGGQAIIKPLDGAGGRNVFHLRSDDRNLNALLEASTDEGRRLAMLQEYLPEVREGDRRILLLDGEPLGAILRVPLAGETRSNIHVGGRVERHALTARDLEICRTVAPRLRADGLYFVGLDVIGSRLTEVNVTSPTGIQELDRLDGHDATGRTVSWLEQRVAAIRPS
ncbi:MAG: glutathione synthase [Deltaproteobacteria bacterium]|nr:glutathione synthase [Deltaproteobacteria bacterium]